MSKEVSEWPVALVILGFLLFMSFVCWLGADILEHLLST